MIVTKHGFRIARANVGKGVVVIPSDPNMLLERIDLLLASKEAGNTDVENEVLSICDELKRKGVVVIPSDPNALLERIDLLLASKEAGNTGVKNEVVSICDELKRKGVLKY